MKITKDTTGFFEQLPAIAMPQYLMSFVSSIDYGYLIEGDYILPFIICKKIIFRWIDLTTGVLNCQNNDDEQAFLQEAFALLKPKNIDFIRTQNTSIFRSYPQKSLYCKFGTYLLSIDKTEDVLFAALHAKHRNVIRKAEKDGVIISNSLENFQQCVFLVQETFRRQNKPYPPLEYFTQLKLLGEQAEFWLASFNGEVQGGAIFLWTRNNSCYYLCSGSIEHPQIGSMNYLIWKSILAMKERDVKFFDFVGARVNPPPNSKLEGIQRFKERFGCTFVEGYLFKYIIHQYKYKLYQILMKIFYFIKGAEYYGDLIDQEIARGNQD